MLNTLLIFFASFGQLQYVFMDSVSLLAQYFFILSDLIVFSWSQIIQILICCLCLHPGMFVLKYSTIVEPLLLNQFVRMLLDPVKGEKP